MSKPKIETRDATFDDVVKIAPNIREEDRIECHLQTGKGIEEAIVESMLASSDTWVGTADGEPFFLGGIACVSPMLGVGAPWMVGTPKIVDVRVPFLRFSCYYNNRIREAYPILVNYVHAENEAAVQWLTWLGFEMGEPEPHGPFGAPFRRFEWRR